jgi:hypothetical protein
MLETLIRRWLGWFPFPPDAVAAYFGRLSVHADAFRERRGSNMKVRNLNGTSQLKCASGTWLAHWEDVCGQNAFLCSTKDCIETPSAGGLVQRDALIDRTWYVIPLCDECNKRTRQDLEIWDLARLVAVLETKVEQLSSLRRRGLPGRRGSNVSMITENQAS